VFSAKIKTELYEAVGSDFHCLATDDDGKRYLTGTYYTQAFHGGPNPFNLIFDGASTRFWNWGDVGGWTN
jgi:hypothetical protein